MKAIVTASAKASMFMPKIARNKPADHRAHGRSRQAGARSTQRRTQVGLHHDERADRGPVAFGQPEKLGDEEREYPRDRGLDGLFGAF